MAPQVLDRSGRVPDGFRQVERKDNRLNPQRGPRSARGDAQSDAIWSRTVPRTLLEVPTDRAVVELPAGTLLSPAEAEVPLHLRLSTRSAPGTAAPASLAAPAPRTWSGDR